MNREEMTREEISREKTCRDREISQELNIRRMKKEDVPAVSQIEAAVFSMPWSPQGFLDALRQDTLFAVAEQNGETAGYCGMYCSREEGEITNVAVASRYRRQGVGRRMVRYLLEQAAEKGITRVVLEVRVSNSSAVRLYEKLGFCTVGVRKGFYEHPREDAYIMTLESIPTFR